MAIRGLDKKEEFEKKILQMSEVSLWLYSYDDIFSDFDPRPYSEKALSEDFLTEAKKISKEKSSGQLQLKFSVPAKSRDAEKEKAIKKRLHEHFKKHHVLLKIEKRDTLKMGFSLATLGLAMMLLSAYVRYLNNPQFMFMLLFVILEPAGWFMAWYGFDHIFQIFRRMNPEVDFYERMSKSDISFMSY